MLIEGKEDAIYASVLADGKIHVTVPEGTEGAVIRKYKTSDGMEGTKTERVYSEVIGKITKLAFYEGDYGRSLQVTIFDGENKPVILSLGTSSNYGEDFMKKVFNIDMEKTVKIVPYSFEDEKGKKKRGITIWQEKDGENVKIKNYFYDEVLKMNVNGYPEPKKSKKPLSKDQWKLYFGEVREFLVEKINEKFGLEKVEVTKEDDELNDFDKIGS